ncbi:MAG: pantoate--beta-alanine ligase [Bacteroidetes bacterium]|nr:pantoate--beta-alanine ligase [Bacteroidota bacterium]
MNIIRRVTDMQRESDRLRAAGASIGFVPTMGYLHEGHLDLLRIAISRCDISVCSIFVNPTQFGRDEDLARYPRDFERDCALIEALGCDILFAPDESEMYPEGDCTFVHVDHLTNTLEGAFRPTHFRGVTTVVTKLFLAVRPQLAVFGQKDAQQVAVIRRMTRDLHFGVEIAVAPIRREKDGLAMSSRNTYLGEDERREALALFRSLQRARKLHDDGERSAANIQRFVAEEILRSGTMTLDYAAVVHPDTMEQIEDEIHGAALVVVAARIGSTRLIDNTFLGSEGSSS